MGSPGGTFWFQIEEYERVNTSGRSGHNTLTGPLPLIIPSDYPLSVKSFGLSSFNHTGAVAFNDLPGDITSIQTRPIFKSKVK